jgi:exonuclease III
MADKLDLPQVRGFKMVSLNIASLPLHIDEFRTWLDNKNIDVIALNETRLDNTLSATNQLKINNYELVRKDPKSLRGRSMYIYKKSYQL